MKFIQIMSASSHTDGQRNITYFASKVFEITHSLTQIVDIMVSRYGDDYKEITLTDMMNDYSYELINEFSTCISDPDYINTLFMLHAQRHPNDAGLSSTMSNGIIPFSEHFPVNDVIEISADLLREHVTSTKIEVSTEGFLNYLNEGHSEQLFMTYINQNAMDISVALGETDFMPELEITRISKLALEPVLNTKDIRALDVFFDNYKNSVHAANYTASKSVEHNRKLMAFAAENGVIFTP